MRLPTVLQFAHSLLEQTVQSGDDAIDATVGNGHDTVFLASLVGKSGRVFGFDIQKTAIENTKKRLHAHGLIDRVTLFQTSHECVKKFVSPYTKKIKAAIFNLGYLPGGDKSIVTKPSSTLKAVKAIYAMLEEGGRIVLVVYPGHEGGREEKDELLAYARTIDQREAHVLKYEYINQVNDPPFVICIEKRMGEHR